MQSDFDDDDIYLPHSFRTQAEALKQAVWSRPGLVLLEHNDGLREADTGGLYHGGWAFRKSAFQKVIGYGSHNNGEDQELAHRLHDSNASEIDPCTFADLADDDHGPLELQEILLAGCPTVGVRTGAPFVVSAKAGFIVDSLPPGSRSLTTCSINHVLKFIYKNSSKLVIGTERSFPPRLESHSVAAVLPTAY